MLPLPLSMAVSYTHLKVQLFGEGYFEVEADPEHPFSVSTSEGLRVIAYGTKFNVNAYDDEPFIEAVLEKGKIDVIEWSARQLSSHSDSTFVRQRIDVYQR